MVLQMTRAEYEKKYGVKPVISSAPNMDVKPAPRRMTRAEYIAEFMPPEKSLSEKMRSPFEETARGGVEQFTEGVKRLYKKPELDTQKIKETADVAGLSGATLETLGQIGKGAFNRVRGLGQIVGGGAVVGLNPLITGATAIGTFAGEKIGQVLPTSVGDTAETVFSNPEVADTIEGIFDIANLAVPEGVKAVTPKLRSITAPVVEAVDAGAGKIKGVIDARQNQAIDNVADEIGNIENNYSKLRKENQYVTDEGAASRRRIAESGVLSGSVSPDGKIFTKGKGGAVEAYKKATIEGDEGIVRDLLIEEGKLIKLREVAKQLTLEVNRAGLEGSELVKALAGLKAEIAGLKLRASAKNDIELSKIHDAKISTTENINYKTDDTPSIKFKKAKARAYKTLVEDNSEVSMKVGDRDVGVRDINKELGKYYEDIERLEKLDGRLVKGGRLSKYSSQITGTIVGSVAGSAFGPLGSAVGGVIAGEVGRSLRGRAMQGTFGNVGRGVPENQVLKAAKLRIPDKEVVAPKDIPKNKAISDIEKDIKKNVEQQKKAIKKGDFALVATLKEVYKVLVQTLKDLVQKVKDTPNKQGGFISNPLGSSKGPKRPETSPQESKPSPNNSTSGKGSQDLLQEAKKYDTPEEFVKTQTLVYHGSPTPLKKFSNKKGGVFFTEEYTDATGFAGSPDNVYEGYLNFKKPLVIDAKGAKWDQLDTKYGKSTQEVISNAQKDGYDGVTFTNIIDNIMDDAEVGIPGTIHYAYKPQDSFINESQLTDIWNEANKADFKMGDIVVSELLPNRKYKLGEIKNDMAEIYDPETGVDMGVVPLKSLRKQ